MRIPHKIDKNTHETYKPSPESLKLVHEDERLLISEDFNWDSGHYPELKQLCIDVIQKHFEEKVILDELPCTDRDYLLETLSITLPLELVVPLIEEEVYWQRRYTESYGIIKRPKPQVWTWKRLYLEKFMEQTIEQAQPEHRDEYDMQETTALLCPYVQRLLISQLQHWKPPLHWDEEDIPEVHPIEHIDFDPIFKKLVNVTEFSLVYGMNSVGDMYKKHMFEVSVVDCQKLGKAISHLKFLEIFRLRRSKIEDAHCHALAQGLIRNETIVELDLSHCDIGDTGALCIAKILLVHPTLKILNLRNNKIRTLGAEGIGFAILQPQCVLDNLNISFNPLEENGVMGILRALVRGTELTKLSLAGCQMDGDVPERVGQMLKLNTSLKKLDISNNWFDDEGGRYLCYGMEVNKTLEWMDLRETDISLDQKLLIKKYLHRNRAGADELEDSEEEEEECGEGEEDEEEEEEEFDGVKAPEGSVVTEAVTETHNEPPQPQT